MEALWRNQLAEQMPRTGMVLEPGQIDLLVRYLGLLDKWNQAYNLTAITERQIQQGKTAD